MVSKHADNANSSSAEVNPSTTTQCQSASQPISSPVKSSSDTAQSSQKPTILDGDETIHIEQPVSSLYRHASAPQQRPLNTEVLPQLLSRPHGSSISLRLTINGQAIHLEGARTALTEASSSEEGRIHVINVADGQIEHAVIVCPRCDGWSEWAVLGREKSSIDNVYSTCSLCHGDGTIPNEHYFRSMRRSRQGRRRGRRCGGGSVQAQSAATQGQGNHLRRSLANSYEQFDNGAGSTSNGGLPTNRELPIRAARGQRRAREIPDLAVQPAPSSCQQIPNTSASARNIGCRLQGYARARKEAVNLRRGSVAAGIRAYLQGDLPDALPEFFEPFPGEAELSSTLKERRRLEAIQACIRLYLEGSLPEALPSVVEQFPDEVELSTSSEEGFRRAHSPESPHHTDRYRRAVRDFRGQQLDDDLMRPSLSPPTLRRLTPWHYVY